jgi:hypothetical protein
MANEVLSIRALHLGSVTDLEVRAEGVLKLSIELDVVRIKTRLISVSISTT